MSAARPDTVYYGKPVAFEVAYLLAMLHVQGYADPDNLRAARRDVDAILADAREDKRRIRDGWP